MTEKVVYVQGTWDLFHVGHLNIIRRTHGIGKNLIVGVNTDESVRKYKGHLPIIRYADRAMMVGACRYVWMVIKSDLTINAEVLKDYYVDVCVLGTDWKDKELEGVQKAMEAGIEIRYFPRTDGISSTEIKERIRGVV